MGEKTITEEKLEKLIEQKVEKKINKNSCNSGEEHQQEGQADDISRRQFLKKAGITTAGLAALSLTPTTALEQTHPLNQITINQDLDMTDFQDTKNHKIKNAQRVTTGYLETYGIYPTGVDIHVKDDLDMKGNDIKNVGNIEEA